MEKTMTPSEPLSAGQISKVYDLLVAGLRKAGLPSEPSQVVIETQGGEFVEECIAAFRKRVEAISSVMITRRVKVNRGLKPQEVLDATGRKQYTNGEVVAIMPKGEGDEAEVVFFKLDRWVSDADLEKEYALRGLKPADPYSLAAVNQADPAFADEKPNGTHWQDADGKWCFAAFYRWFGGRFVVVFRIGGGWVDVWWVAGLRK